MQERTDVRNIPENDLIFAMDIGTRSIIGMVGVMEENRLRILEIAREVYAKRAMLDGQIEDIAEVAAVGRVVKERLEAQMGRKLTRVCIAAAGRALKTQHSKFKLHFSEPTRLNDEHIGRLESGALTKAEAEFRRSMEDRDGAKYYLVSHTVVEYQVDGYPMSNLLDHKGQDIQAEVVATFLPSEVVNSLYTTMHLLGLNVISLTLEPIAAMNAVIPAKLRLLNLALVDIGAGTSDIAISRDGGIIGYTMSTVAGDEITETLMKKYLLDFDTAEKVKMELRRKEDVHFTDILGIEQTYSQKDVEDVISPARDVLCKEIAQRITEVNGGKAPSAVFLAGGGSKLSGIRDTVAKYLDMDINRVAVAGKNFEQSAFSDEYILNDSEYATPLGIAISAGFNLIGDSFRVTLNGQRTKLFRNGTLTIQDLLTMNGYSIQNFLPRNGANIVAQINGKRKIFRGGIGKPAALLLNGKKARLSDIVRAGDAIEFTSASKGQDARVTVGEALGSNSLMVTVNGEAVSPSRLLADGDVVCSEPVEELYENHEPPMADDVSRLPVQEKTESLRQETTDETSQNSRENRGIEIMFNGENRVFPAKTDGEPYYLMNLLKYSNFSLDHPDGDVILQVNGKPGSFLDVIHPQDHVDIFCKKHVAP